MNPPQWTTRSAPSRSTRAALKRFQEYFKGLFQRRHDCIHNCDRPKIALQQIRDSEVKKRIDDVAFLAGRSHEALCNEFPIYLRDLGFNGVTRNRVSA